MQVVLNNFSGGIDRNLSGRLADLKKAQMSYNFNFSGGALKHDVGFEALFGGKIATCDGLDSLIIGDDGAYNGCIFLYQRYDFEREKQDDKLVIFDKNFDGYYINLFASEPKLLPLNISFSAKPTAENYRLSGKDVLIMASSENNMVVWDGENPPEVIVDAPRISSMDIHYERLFATSAKSEYTLNFSDDLDPTNWSESLNDAGFIDFVDERGKLKKVLSFNDYLYGFRERGISRVYASSVDQTGFYVNHLFTAGGRIIPSTISLCGDKIIFMATDGMYVFDGSSAYRKLPSVFPLIDLSVSPVATFNNGKYYLACHVDFCENKSAKKGVCNALLEVDAETFEYKLIKGRNILDILSLSIGGEEKLVLLTSNGESHLEVLSSAGDFSPALYKTGLTPLVSSRERKVLRGVAVVGEKENMVTLFNEKGERLSVLFSDGSGSESVCFSFKKLGVEIKSLSLGSVVEEVCLKIY